MKGPMDKFVKKRKDDGITDDKKDKETQKKDKSPLKQKKLPFTKEKKKCRIRKFNSKTNKR